jgi:lipoate synthase
MAVLIEPSNLKVISQNGQVTLALQIELNINLNSNVTTTDAGNSGGSHNFKTSTTPLKNAQDEEKTEWLVPDFTAKEKVKFGK